MANDAARTNLSDGAGEDWLNMAAMTGDLHVDLNAGATSTSNGAAFLTIAAGTNIENAVAGDGNDTLIGNALDNHLLGMRGDDILWGGGGNDTLEGGAGSDVFYFTDGFGVALIVDWDPVYDTLNFAEFSEFNNYTDFTANASIVGSDFVYDLGGDSINKIVFVGVTEEDFASSDFDFDTVLIA